MAHKDSLDSHPLVAGTKVIGEVMVNGTRKATEYSKVPIRTVVDVASDMVVMTLMPGFFLFVREMEKDKKKGLSANLDLSGIAGPAGLQTIRLLISIGAALVFDQPSAIDATAKGFAVAGIIDAGLMAVYYLGYREKKQNIYLNKTRP